MNRRELLGAGALLAATVAAGPVLAAGDVDRFSVVVRGKGPDVILIPGLASSRAVWAPTAKALEDRYRVHLVQVAGFAGDPAGANVDGAVAAGVAEGLAAYIQAKGLKAPAVIGHSLGGTIGLMLAARHPGLVGRLMVVDMFPNLAMAYFGPGASREAVAKGAADFRQRIETASPDQYLARQNQTAVTMVLTESARQAVVDDSLASDRKVVGRAMEELLTTDLAPELPNITAPTTVVWAWNKASFAPAEAFAGWYGAAYAPLKGVRIVRIDEAAHFVMIDQPARFQAEVEAFLKP